MSMIKNIDALNQPLDYEPFTRYCKCMTDLDGVLQLEANDKIFLIEIKKDTFNHSVNKIINSSQWKLYQNLANNRPNYFIVYATHNQPIDLRVAINAIDCRVRYLENCGKSINVSNFEDLLSCIHYYAFKKDISEKHYIVIRYPNKTLHYAIRKPIQKMWSMPTYANLSCDFDSLEEAIKYINTRYKAKSVNGTYFNKDNKYLVYRAKDDQLIKEYSYNDFHESVL